MEDVAKCRFASESAALCRNMSFYCPITAYFLLNTYIINQQKHSIMTKKENKRMHVLFILHNYLHHDIIFIIFKQLISH